MYTQIEHLVGEKAFANEITFIEMQQLHSNEEHKLNVYDLKIFIE